MASAATIKNRAPQLSTSVELYRFVDGVLVQISEGSADTNLNTSLNTSRNTNPFTRADEVNLAAADSWLVEDGRVRSLDLHFARFSAGLEANAQATSPISALDLADFYDAVMAKLPLTGRWFPRIEYHAECPENPLFFRLREAPDQLNGMVLYSYEEPDPRVNPTVKGPDLSLGMQLRRKAIVHGADEAVLLTAEGFISEGALSSLVWWQGNVLCAPDHEIPWIDSVTRREVFEIAKALGLETKLVKARPADLAGLEIWGLSSLQGIRLVTDWVNLGAPVGKANHLETFQRRLRMLAGPLPTGRQVDSAMPSSKTNQEVK